jgi:hypothetical protein
MSESLQAIPEWHDVGPEQFRRDIAPLNRPAVLRGAAAHWPVVALAKSQPPLAVCQYLAAMDNGHDVDAVMTRPESRGRIFYSDDYNGFNFLRNRLPISKVMEQLLRYLPHPNPPAVAVQSALLADCLPEFAKAHRLPLLDEAVAPRIWMGNAITTPAHIDESHNIACVVAGRRRFTLFPTEQVANLYLGPLDFTPTGSPISLVDFKNPDFERFPRFRQALAAAQVAELAPGDAIFIPTLWWHQVESLEGLNILVNYWWKETVDGADRSASQFDGLMHTLVNMKGLPQPHKEAWRALFEHYVFGPEGQAAEHIPPARRGVLGPLTDQRLREIKQWLLRRLQ